MREMIFKNLTADDFKKRDILITEVVEGDGVIAKIERRCKYFVTNMNHFDNVTGYEEIMKSKICKESPIKKEYFILRKKDDDSGEDVLICKVFGNLYAVVEDYVFYVAYLHTIKVKLSTLSAKK